MFCLQGDAFSLYKDMHADAGMFCIFPLGRKKEREKERERERRRVIVAVAALDSVSIVVDDVVVGVLILMVVIIDKEVVERI